MSELAPLQIELGLTDLLASKKEKIPDGRRRLSALAEQYAQKFEPEESLGYQHGKRTTSRVSFIFRRLSIVAPRTLA
jgi:hypothetical protein